MKTIVISGINLFEGGPLSVYKDCLNSLINSGFNKKYKIICFVHKKILFNEFNEIIEIIELPKSRDSYLYRLYYEYVYFNSYSKRNKIYLWLSLHDITPSVKVDHLYTYCHNPTPFLKAEIKNIKYSKTNFLFALFYKYLYQINIKKNDAIIVQQDWLRDAFKKMYKVSNVIVSRPNVESTQKITNVHVNSKRTKFLFPSYPRFFKNFELICDACEILKKNNIEAFDVYLTLDGTENNYSKILYKKYCHLSNIKWIGIQKRDALFNLYAEVDCLIFPSKLETWGLPISEFKMTEKPIFIPNLAYAHETIGTYEKVCFFSPSDPSSLSELMQNEVLNKNTYIPCKHKEPIEPFARSWESLFQKIGM